MTVAGVDACKTGWIAVVLADGAAPAAHHLSHIAALDALLGDAVIGAVGIDIPIGLPRRGWRAADLAARPLLGRRRHSLFLTPPRAVLEAPTHAEATRRAVALGGAGISQQSFGLRHKIFEVEAWLPTAPVAVVEVHPELSFTAMLGRPPAASKRTWAGMVERRTALAADGIELDHVTGPAGTSAAVDDMLDAAAAAWSARRVLRGEARCLPDPPERDAHGWPMAIWT